MAATRQEYNQLQAFARVDGAQVAVLWIASFALFVMQFEHQMLSLLSFAVGVGSLVYASWCVIRFRDRVRGGVLSFWQALSFGLLTYLYAALLFALAQFIYFQFMDGGYMMEHYYTIVSTDEYRQMMRIYGITESDMQLAMDGIAALRPIEIAMQFFTLNIIMGFLVSLPMAVLARRSARRT